MKLTKNELHNLVREVISESHTKEQEEELKSAINSNLLTIIAEITVISQVGIG